MIFIDKNTMHNDSFFQKKVFLLKCDGALIRKSVKTKKSYNIYINFAVHRSSFCMLFLN